MAGLYPLAPDLRLPTHPDQLQEGKGRIAKTKKSTKDDIHELYSYIRPR